MNAPEHFAAAFACAGKERYATKARAIETILRRQRRARHPHKGRDSHDRRELALLTAYRCEFCHHWHVGSDHGLK